MWPCRSGSGSRAPAVPGRGQQYQRHQPEEDWVGLPAPVPAVDHMGECVHRAADPHSAERNEQNIPGDDGQDQDGAQPDLKST